ncbi:MAG: class I SAM-dependent rRNA methyltransferase [Bacteroidales bacterium]|nr:class I SAM-dependent rRNA methyltransferase [Bacteroidales bacterium]
MIKVFLKKGREESLLRFHPWVFSGAIASVQGSPAEGDLVAVYSADGRYMACGHYQIGSIAVRVLSFDGDPSSPSFWKDALQKALDVRKTVGLYSSAGNMSSFGAGSHSGLLASQDPSQLSLGPSLLRAEGGNGSECEPAPKETNCFRLVHGEGDSLPGLIIDWYDGVCVMQAHSVGMFRAKKQICDALKEVFGARLKAVYDKSSGTAPFKAGLDLIDGYIYTAPGFNDKEQVVFENGHRFLVNWTEGQKTGFFLDQRENRALVGRYAGGRKVLNLFCYTGGFSVYALAAGALCCDSVDSSAKAVSLLQKNIELNFGCDAPHNSICADAIEYLGKCPAGKYDLMIVDPPAFAKHRGVLKNALKAYQRLNAAAISKVAPGGLIFTFSCSQVVDKEAFALAVFSAAAQTGRRVRILDRLCQPADHSVSIYHPEGEYLKGLLLYVE